MENFASDFSTTRAERLTPERPSLSEALRLSRLGIIKAREARRALIKRRLTRLRPSGFLTTSEAAFFLACSRYSVTALIRAGRLHALKAKSDGRFPFVYRIPAEHVRAIAEALA